jgi:PAS domain S-box-containing protein
LIYNSADGALIINDGGDVVFANPAAEQLFGRSGDNLIGKPFGFPVVNSDRTVIHFDAFLHRAPADMDPAAERGDWF